MVLVCRHLLVSHLEELQRGLLEVGDSLLDVLGVHVLLVLQFVSHLHNLLLHLGHILARQLVLKFVHLALGVVKDPLGLVDGLHPLPVDLVLLGVGLGLPHHVLDLVLAETSAGLDDDLLFFPSSLVPGVNIHDSVGIFIKSNRKKRIIFTFG